MPRPFAHRSAASVQRLALARVALALLALGGVAPCAQGQAKPPAAPAEVPLATKLKLLARDAKESADKRRLPAWEGLLALGEPGCATLRPIVEAKLARDRKALEERLKGNELAHARKKVEAALVERRAAALACIFDPKRYPDENHGAVGQAEVDRLVAAVRAAWERPAVFLRELVPEFEQLAAGLEEAVVYLEACGAPPVADLADVNEWLGSFTPRFERESLGISGSQHDWNEAVAKWLAEEMVTSADESERACMDATNDYRRMMGRPLLEIDERLVRAARKHSEEMDALHYFSHGSPVAANASFGGRCAREGYRGASGENIAGAGDGVGAFRGWYGSSGHHRNMLGGHQQFGVGRAGSYPGNLFTQNFGGGDSLRGRTVDDPQIDYLRRKKKLEVGSADAQAALAAWCKSVGLADLARLHAEAALALDPQHAKARELLGHVDGR
ncbi:MAG: hypothetical protein JNL90_19035 [Planctomycetes bacterium]|nr:hypothetical protein [Planctomycetota bacterium]